MSAPLISVEGLSKRFRIDSEKVGFGDLFRGAMRLLGGRAAEHPMLWALKDVSFTIAPGERIGIIGKNGAGKSTLLKILSRVSYPTAGCVRIRGRVTALLEVGTGFSDDLTGRENIFLNASLYGLSRAEIEQRLEQIIDFSEIRRFVDTPIKHYSSGMRMRLAFSVAAHLDPDILILDEVLAVGDLSFQRKCLERMGELTSGGRTLLFVSHSMEAINRFCDRVIWLDQGQVIGDGPAEEITGEFMQRFMGLRASLAVENPPEVPPAQDPAPIPAAEPEPFASGGDVEATEIAHPVAESVSSPVSPAETPSARPEGDVIARIVSARVLDADGHEAVTVEVVDPVDVEVVFDLLTPGDVEPAIHVKTPKDFAFAVAYLDEGFPNGVREPGRYRSIVRIPPNLLNTGVYFVNLALVTPDPLTRHVLLEDALSFHVHEPSDPAGTSRGRYGRGFPGSVRPKLEWRTERTGRSEVARKGTRLVDAEKV